jgi:hypothetical protein
MAELFQLAQKKAGIRDRWPQFSLDHFRRRSDDQLSFF